MYIKCALSKFLKNIFTTSISVEMRDRSTRLSVRFTYWRTKEHCLLCFFPICIGVNVHAGRGSAACRRTTHRRYNEKLLTSVSKTYTYRESKYKQLRTYLET